MARSCFSSRNTPLASWLVAVLPFAALLACSSSGAVVRQETRELSEPEFIPFTEGEPATVFWSDQANRLYIADNQNNQIWRWDDTAGLEKHATTPDPGGALAAGATLVGQIVEQRDGTLVVTRFGQPGGGFSAVAWVRPDGSSGLVPGVDETKKHLGIAEAADGALYGTFFGRAPSGMGQAGSVTRIDLEAGESLVADGFGKLVGIVAVGDTLYVSDQTAGILYSAPLAALPPRASEWTVFAELPVPDQVCVGPDGSLFSGQFQAAPESTESVAIRQVHADGSVTRFAADPVVAKPSGVSYDAEARRLFATDTGNVAQIGVHIFPVP